MRTRAHRYSLAAGLTVALVALTACAGGGSSGDGGAGSGASGADAAASEPGRALSPGEKPGTGSGTGPDTGVTGAGRTSVRTTSVVRTGEISVTSQNLSKARDEVDALLSAIGGTVDSEHTTSGKEGGIDRSTLVLRVPVGRFDAAKDALERLGTLKSSTESAEDVTTQVIDTAERVETLQNSLDRLQRFQRSAEDVDDLIRFEEQITQRQSELQSLQAQQSYLSDQTSMSTITLRLSTPDKSVEPGVLDDAGFLSGLHGGWKALVGFVVVALTVLGAMLPFLAAFALLGIPVWFGLRALIRRRVPAAPAETS